MRVTMAGYSSACAPRSAWPPQPPSKIAVCLCCSGSATTPRPWRRRLGRRSGLGWRCSPPTATIPRLRGLSSHDLEVQLFGVGLAAPLQTVALRFGSLSEPSLDRPIGQSLAIDAGGFARLDLAECRDVLGKVLLAPSRKDALNFLGCEFADANGHLPTPLRSSYSVVAQASAGMARPVWTGAWRP